MRLRVATANGGFDPARALALGAIDHSEYDEMTARTTTQREHTA
jgi:hypothetical protein